ncbi:nucleoside-diphosphate-sugar epimerase [Ilumatobacter fluminis]|uniref:Nucleoside-diphosphate-sugar epimerase n=1 Tax=Ilumatobacter fluminis TaxID=467091 RepID=A0A4R7HVE0_9ACTN|nr:NAD-dependent epimerase/dehydratase family protein [Ilumatobacter fluminis]TDT14957.1 nucleoside-diphosphate-sugar epimerase [Ilumatobacter fluminis]
MTRVLYVGGTGEISHACVERSLAAGHDVAVLNRGNRSELLPDGVESIVGDLRSDEPYAALGGRTFDVVCQFMAFDGADAVRDIEAFSGRCGQFVFVSSAAVYRRPIADERVTESTPVGNSFSAYGLAKLACERTLLDAQQAGVLPVTIVRPSHTYRTRLPSAVLQSEHQTWRMLAGKPILVHDDGDSMWTLTHAADFASAFVGLFESGATVGSTFNITSETALSWNTILRQVGGALDLDVELVHVPTDTLVEYEPQWSAPLRGDKADSMIFDTSHVRSVVDGWRCEVTLAEGLRRTAEFGRARLASGYQPDSAVDRLVDRIISEHASVV